MEVRDERTVDRLRPCLQRRAGPDRPARRPGRARDRAREGLPRRRPHRDQPGSARPARGAGRVPSRRRRRGQQARPSRPVLPDARAIADELTVRHVKLSLGGSVYDPTVPVGRLLFNVLAMVAEFEADLISMRTREGMKVARAKGRLRGKQPKLTIRQEAHLAALHADGDYTPGELAELFRVGRSTVYRALHRVRARNQSVLTITFQQPEKPTR